MIRDQIRSRVRDLVLSTFPEYDVTSEAKSGVGAMLDQLRQISERVSFLAGQFVPRGQVATVVLLPAPGFEGPPFYSQTLRAMPPHRSSVQEPASFEFPIELYWPLPEKSWIVSHGCRLSAVYLGAYSEVLGPDSNFCWTTRTLEKGVRMRVRVQFE